MTEREWLGQLSLMPKLQYLKGSASDRKLRLFACACCRRAWDRLSDQRSRSAVEAAEQFADGAIDSNNLAVAHQAARAAVAEARGQFDESWQNLLAASDVTFPRAFDAAFSAPVGAASRPDRDYLAEVRAQDALLIDVFGNRFRPVAFELHWRSSDVVNLARGIYEDRAFERLPILADALMDAGCENEHVIAHCRNDGPHVRGCWVVDLSIGKD